jgi:hypothetical protein
MNRDRDQITKGDDAIISLSGRVADVHYAADGSLEFVRIESPQGVSRLFYPRHFRDFTVAAIPDEDFKARWSA